MSSSLADRSRTSSRGRPTGLESIRVISAALAALLISVVWGMVALVLQLQRSEYELVAQRQADALASLVAVQLAARLERLEEHGRRLMALPPPGAASSPLPDSPAEVLGFERRPSGSAGGPSTPPLDSQGTFAMTVRGHAGTAGEREVVVLRVDANRMLAVARMAMAGADGTIVLADNRGRVLAAGPGGDTLHAGGALPDAFLHPGGGLPQEPAGLLSVPGDRDRAWAVVELSRHQLTVGVGASLVEARSQARLRGWLLALAALLETVVAMALAVIANRQAHRLAVLLHRLDVSRQRLRTANQAKTRFLQSISHEMRTPLNGILPSSELMIQLVRSDDQAEIADMINQSAVELATMIDTLIDIADLQAGRLRLDRQEVDVRHLIGSAASSPQTAVRLQGGRLSCAVASTVPERLRLDETRFARVLRALVDAVARIFERPSLRIEASMASGPRLRVIVCCEDARDSVAPPLTEDAEAAAAKGRRPVKIRARDAAAALGLLLIEDLIEVIGGAMKVLEVQPDRLEVELTLPVPPASPAAA